MRATFLGIDRLFCFISISSFGSIKNPFATITFLSDVWFCSVGTNDKTDFFELCSTSSWKPWRWVKLHLIFMMRDIYINPYLNPITKFNCSNSSHGTSLKLSQRPSCIPIWVGGKVDRNPDNMIRISQRREIYCRRNTSFRKK